MNGAVPSVIESGLFAGALFRKSPHFDERPDLDDLSLIVLHCISLPEGHYNTSYVDQLFLGHLDCDAHPSFESLRGLRVSAHCFIRRNGGLIQYVPFQKRAWHAGRSCYQDRQHCNDFSIGIELEGTSKDAYTSTQYRRLITLIHTLRTYYPSLQQADIVGHQDIAPERKTDPGPYFDWHRLKIGLQECTHLI